MLALWLFGGMIRPAAAADTSSCGHLGAADEQLLDQLEHAGFRFFVEQADPHTGLVRDRARADGSPSEGKASIAASGFALSAWVIGVQRGWVDRTAAIDHIRHSLEFLVKDAPRRHGFFYHFMEMDTGARAWNCELSSIDTSLFLAGAIVAREYFADPEITRLVDQLLGDVDWAWFRNGGGLVSMAWHDGHGFSRYRWRDFSEQILLSYLALGTSPHPVEADYWRSWQREPVGRYGRYVYLQQGPLFEYQFPLGYMDLRHRRDAQVDYFRNARIATLAQRQFSIDLRKEFPAWGPELWGITASDSATGYKAWGGPPRPSGYNALDGTVVPCAPAGSLPFAPRETLAVLRHMREAYGDRIWKRYGFVDAFNPDNGWVNPDVLGIDVGISVIQAENLRTGLIWRLFMQSPEARLALTKAGLLSTDRQLGAVEAAEARRRAQAAWQSLQAQPAAGGLQLTALLAAQQLGFLTGDELVTKARALLKTPPASANDTAVAEYAAALITLRQAVPELAAEATRRLGQLSWADASPPVTSLGDTARLTTFLRVADGSQPASAWDDLSRATTEVGPVRVLAPTDVAGALLPGLWLDEQSILSGASASQLAYASLVAPGTMHDAMVPALQLDRFPREALARPAVEAVEAPAAAAYLITTANLLVHDAIRHAFQRDPLVQAGHTRIAEFAQAAFGPDTSIMAQGALSLAPPPAPPRQARAVAASEPSDRWDWQTVAGLAFKDTIADIRPDDPPLTFRFALTWDESALHFHAVVEDTPAGYTLPPQRNRWMELFLNTTGPGFAWGGEHSYQFAYRFDGKASEGLHHAASTVRVTPTAHGYTVEANIPWTSLGLTPRPGLQLGLSAAAVAQGGHDWESMLKLNWSYAELPATGTIRLGTLRLE